MELSHASGGMSSRIAIAFQPKCTGANGYVIHISRHRSEIQMVGAMLVLQDRDIYGDGAMLLFSFYIYLYLRLIMRSDLIW
jgi:hypothetical protein